MADLTGTPAILLLTTQYTVLQGKDIYISSKLAMVELILSGCTCTSDHLYLYPNDVCLEDSIRAARSVQQHKVLHNTSTRQCVV